MEFKHIFEPLPVQPVPAAQVGVVTLLIGAAGFAKFARLVAKLVAFLASNAKVQFAAAIPPDNHQLTAAATAPGLAIGLLNTFANGAENTR